MKINVSKLDIREGGSFLTRFSEIELSFFFNRFRALFLSVRLSHAENVHIVFSKLKKAFVFNLLILWALIFFLER